MYTPHKTSRPFGGRRQKSAASVLEIDRIDMCNVFISTYATIFGALKFFFLFQKFENMSIFGENDVFSGFSDCWSCQGAH